MVGHAECDARAGNKRPSETATSRAATLRGEFLNPRCKVRGSTEALIRNKEITSVATVWLPVPANPIASQSSREMSASFGTRAIPTFASSVSS